MKMTPMKTTVLLAVWAGLLLAASSHAAIVTKTNNEAEDFDGSYGYKQVTFATADFLGDPTIVVDVDVSISFAKPKVIVDDFLGIYDPPGFDEIEFVLISPSGTAITLINNIGGKEDIVPQDEFKSFSFNPGSEGAFFEGTITFDDSAVDSVNTNPHQITSGVYRPDDDMWSNLAEFNGQSAIGTWTLFIEDDEGPVDPFFDPPTPLKFFEYSLTITTASASSHPIPEPSSLVVFGLGIVAVLTERLRRRRT